MTDSSTLSQELNWQPRVPLEQEFRTNGGEVNLMLIWEIQVTEVKRWLQVRLKKCQRIPEPGQMGKSNHLKNLVCGLNGISCFFIFSAYGLLTECINYILYYMNL